MTFKEVDNKTDFVKMEQEVLTFWDEVDAFGELQRRRAKSEKNWSFLDGPITANNPMGRGSTVRPGSPEPGSVLVGAF